MNPFKDKQGRFSWTAMVCMVSVVGVGYTIWKAVNAATGTPMADPAHVESILFYLTGMILIGLGKRGADNFFERKLK